MYIENYDNAAAESFRRFEELEKDLINKVPAEYGTRIKEAFLPLKEFYKKNASGMDAFCDYISENLNNKKEFDLSEVNAFFIALRKSFLQDMNDILNEILRQQQKSVLISDFTNDIARLPKKMKKTEDDTIVFFTRDDIEYYILKYKSDLSINAHKIIMIASMAAVEQKKMIVTIPINKIIKLLGWESKSLETCKKELRRELNILQNFKIKFKGNGGNSISAKVAGSYKIGESVAIAIDPAFYETLKKPSIFPLALLQVPQRVAYQIGVKLCQHWHIPNNRKRGSNKTLKVASLLDWLELAKPTKKHTWREVQKKPLEEGLNQLKEAKIIKNWAYREENDTTADTWKSSFITFELPEKTQIEGEKTQIEGEKTQIEGEKTQIEGETASDLAH